MLNFYIKIIYDFYLKISLIFYIVLQNILLDYYQKHRKKKSKKVKMYITYISLNYNFPLAIERNIPITKLEF